MVTAGSKPILMLSKGKPTSLNLLDGFGKAFAKTKDGHMSDSPLRKKVILLSSA